MRLGSDDAGDSSGQNAEPIRAALRTHAWLVRNLILVPHFVFTASAVEKRKPLTATARRAGFFHLKRRFPHMRAFLRDSNEELINCYRVLRDRTEELMQRLATLLPGVGG
jgi:hypothetical protein